MLPAETADAIDAAAREVADGQHDDQFPIDVFQTGSGTSSNMNANEVIASLCAAAGVEVHPNDHVNASQSSNDIFPTAIHVAAAVAVTDELPPALDALATSLEAKATEFADLVKSGRTHLMDATPVMLGQEFGGYAATIRYGVERLDAVLPRVRELPLGGTAVGTGINTPAGFPSAAIEALADADRPAVHRGTQPLRGPGHPRLAGRAQRRAADDRGRAHQDLQRPALDGRPARRPASPRSTCPTCSPGRRSCPARSTRCCPRPR